MNGQKISIKQTTILGIAWMQIVVEEVPDQRGGWPMQGIEDKTWRDSSRRYPIRGGEFRQVPYI